MSGLPIRRLAGFVGLQGLSVIVPLIVLPAINAQVGRPGWVSLSLGYGIGSAAAIGCGFAWPMLGPHQVANRSPGDSADVYWESLVTRGTMWVVSSLVALALTALLTSGPHLGLAICMALAMTTWGLTPSWYFIGKGDARAVARYETFPRIASSALSIPLVHGLSEPLMYPLMVSAASALSLLTASRRILSASPGRPRLPSGWQERARQHAGLAGSALVGAGYTSLVLPAAKLAHPGLVPLANIAGAVRLRNMAQMGSAAITSGLQGWVAYGDEGSREKAMRRRRALAVSTTAGLVSTVTLFLLMPLVGTLIFGDVTIMSWELSFCTAAACVPYAVGASLSFHVLAPAQRTRVIGRSRVVASLVGVPAIILGARLWGAEGVMVATFVAETVVVMWQWNAAKDLLRRPPARHATTTARAR